MKYKPCIHYTLYAVVLIVVTSRINAQHIVAPQTPQQQSFGQVTTVPLNTGNTAFGQQKKAMPQQYGISTGLEKQQPNETAGQRKELREEERKQKEEKYLALQKPFKNSLQEFLKMNPDDFSVTKAIYLAESPWYGKPPTYQQFENAIKLRANLVRQIIKNEGLAEHNNTAINYAIQKLYMQDMVLTNPKTNKTAILPKLSYDFNNSGGDSNYTNQFVTKLLMTGKGQCHSMPLLYLAIAEQLGGKAYLSLSPQHSFIEYFDEKGYRYNFETTCGHLVTQDFLMQSGYINATALKNKTFLDTLGSRKLYAECLGDLLNTYIDKVEYDQFSDQLTAKILSIDPNNQIALMNNSNLFTHLFRVQSKALGYPPVKDLPKYPEVNAAYKKMHDWYDRVDQTGYQDMPKEAYKKWLQSVEAEKQRHENQQVQQRMAAEVEKLKKGAPKSTIKQKLN